ncbi:HAD-IA family hydrolase [Mesorhizobium sp. NPDC059054]|uniref:HAD-IA family hydrolase n=1 Tax=Mesorhizobium sp. NPDC059054 TaxID=3346711 RepID=UPI0036C2DCE7
MTLPFPDHTFGAFLFDMDGTILSSIAAAERVWAAWAQKHGLDVETFLPTIHGVRAVETIRRLNLPGIDVMAEVEALTQAEFEDVEGIEAIAGAAAFLNALPSQHWAIVTSSPRRLAIRRLEATGLPVPPVMITGEDVANGKPAPDCFLLAAERLGQKPQDCLVFEDAPAGIQAAEAAGTKVVVVTATHKHAAETPHPTIAGYGSLIPLLNGGGKLVLANSGPTISATAGA